MPGLAFSADCHLGNHRVLARPAHAGVNDRARDIAALLSGAAHTAHARGAEALVLCGDVVDNDRPSPQELALACEALGDSTVQVVAIIGNHDQRSMLPGDHALGPLAACQNVRVIERPTVVPLGAFDLLAVPFHNADARQYIPAAVASLARYRREGAVGVLAVHAGIADARTPPFLRDSHEAIEAEALLDLLVANGLTYAAAGNWHDRRRWQRGGVTVQQCGALCPTGFDNPGGAGRYGTVAFCDTACGPYHVELAGPRFHVVRTEAELAEALSDSTAARRYIAVKLPPEVDPAPWRARLDKLAADSRVHAYRIDGDTSERGRRLRAAAEGAKSATTLDDALGKYVAAMPLPPDVTPVEMLAVLNTYLGAHATLTPENV